MSIAATASSTAPTMSGLASGMDWTSIINEMVAVEQAPETQMEAQQTTLKNEGAAYTTIGTDLTALQKDVTTLMDPEFLREPHRLRRQFLGGQRHRRRRHSPGQLTLSIFRNWLPMPPGRAPPRPPIPSAPPMIFPA